MPIGSTLVLGDAPQLTGIGDIAVLGPQQIAVNGGTLIAVVTLP